MIHIIHYNDDMAIPDSPVNFRTLDLNLLKVFDEVMTERNLTRAAAHLAMTQPAVSNAIKRLREALKDELLVRSGYGVVPTPRALEVWPVVRAALTTLQEALSPALGFDPAGSRETFVIAMADATAASLMPPLMRHFEARAPGASIRARPLLSRDPREALASGELDLAVGYFPAVIAAIDHATMQAGTPDPVSHQRLYDGEYVCVMRADHPLTQAGVSLDTYCAARHVLVSFSGRPYGFVDEALSALGRRRRVVLTVNEFFTAAQVVAQTDLLTILPRHFIGSTGIAAQLAWRRLPLEMPVVHVDMLWHRRHQKRLAHEWLRQQVALAARDVYGEPPPTRLD
jgi:DNA-binding transcriptional LysR family regulator